MRLCAALLLILACSPRIAIGAVGAPADRELAKRHYELGESLYNRSKPAEAVEEFKKAYELSAAPGLLFNIARCYELLGKIDLAIEYYRRYLEKSPDAENRAVVEARITSLEERRRAEAQSKPAVPPPPPPITVAPPPPREPPPPPSRWRRTAGWITIGVGGAALVTGIVLGVVARNKADEVLGGRGTTPWADLEPTDREGKRFNAAAIAMIVVGSVAAAAGAGLVVWDYTRRETRSPTGVSVLPYGAPGGAGLTAAATF